MPQPTGTSLLDRFAALEDPRQRAKVLYPLPEILLLCSVPRWPVRMIVLKSSSGARSNSPSCVGSCLISTGFQATTR